MPAKEELKNRNMTTIGFEKQVRKMICMVIEPKDVIADLLKTIQTDVAKGEIIQEKGKQDFMFFGNIVLNIAAQEGKPIKVGLFK